MSQHPEQRGGARARKRTRSSSSDGKESPAPSDSTVFDDGGVEAARCAKEDAETHDATMCIIAYVRSQATDVDVPEELLATTVSNHLVAYATGVSTRKSRDMVSVSGYNGEEERIPSRYARPCPYEDCYARHDVRDSRYSCDGCGRNMHCSVDCAGTRCRGCLRAKRREEHEERAKRRLERRENRLERKKSRGDKDEDVNAAAHAVAMSRLPPLSGSSLARAQAAAARAFKRA